MIDLNLILNMMIGIILGICLFKILVKIFEFFLFLLGLIILALSEWFKWREK